MFCLLALDPCLNAERENRKTREVPDKTPFYIHKVVQVMDGLKVMHEGIFSSYFFLSLWAS